MKNSKIPEIDMDRETPKEGLDETTAVIMYFFFLLLSFIYILFFSYAQTLSKFLRQTGFITLARWKKANYCQGLNSILFENICNLIESVDTEKMLGNQYSKCCDITNNTSQYIWTGYDLILTFGAKVFERRAQDNINNLNS